MSFTSSDGICFFITWPSTTSHSSSGASHDDAENSMRMPNARRHHRKASREVKNKENSPPSAGLPLRTIFDVRQPNLVNGEPPSPASSSELSPIAKEMMVSLRKQRMRAREEMRSGGRHGRKAS